MIHNVRKLNLSESKVRFLNTLFIELALFYLIMLANNMSVKKIFFDSS